MFLSANSSLAKKSHMSIPKARKAEKHGPTMSSLSGKNQKQNGDRENIWTDVQDTAPGERLMTLAYSYSFCFVETGYVSRLALNLQLQ